MTLTRDNINPLGVWSTLVDDHGNHFSTLEHAYLVGDGEYAPKIPQGKYLCKRYHSPHRGYDVFMLENVPGHDSIEIHIGNVNADSDGCILIGLDRDRTMIRHSKDAFKQFMAGLAGIDEFTLEVR